MYARSLSGFSPPPRFLARKEHGGQVRRPPSALRGFKRRICRDDPPVQLSLSGFDPDGEVMKKNDPEYRARYARHSAFHWLAIAIFLFFSYSAFRIGDWKIGLTFVAVPLLLLEQMLLPRKAGAK